MGTTRVHSLMGDSRAPSRPGVRARLLRRNPEDSFAVETLASAVATVLATRLYLELTGYPQLGNDTLHVAHVLWGGLLMLVAGRLALGFYGAGIRRLSALLMGAGFGLFIDEIGKFVTRDHDYFFRPAAALIYASFIALYLSSLAVRRLAPADDRTLLLSGIATLEEAARGTLRPDQKAAALQALDRVAASGSASGELARQVREIVARQDALAPAERGWIAAHLTPLRERVLRSPRHRGWLLRAIVAAAVFGLLNVTGSTLVVVTMGATVLTGGWTPGPDFTVAALQAVGSAVAGAFFLRGLWALRRDTEAGLRRIGAGFAVTILVVDVFAFYFHQFGATTGALAGLLLLQGVRTLRGSHSLAATST